jgi:hypothetical protein
MALKFTPKREEVAGGWRSLHKEGLRNLYASPNIRAMKSMRMGWAGHVARMGKKRNGYKILVGKYEGKRPPGRPRHRWEDNITMYFRVIEWEDEDWKHPIPDRVQWRALVNVVMDLRVL